MDLLRYDGRANPEELSAPRYTRWMGFTVDELLTLEHAGWMSLCESRGGSFYGDLMTPDALFILVNGMSMTRDDVAGSLDGAPAWASYEIADSRIVEVADDVAALVYRATAFRDDLPEPFTAQMSSLYCRIDGRPRLSLYQQTTITH